MIQTAPLQCRIEPTHLKRNKVNYGQLLTGPVLVVKQINYRPCLVCILLYILYLGIDIQAFSLSFAQYYF